ncbi:hypothetical protein N8198_10225 [Gammaproteobacteria bacterium]|nr:hypothetical protein [Gammaproteobacteria bacterium]
MLHHDHFFILTKPGAPAAQRLIDIGLIEGSSNRHPGQGTANRRFFLANSTLELLFVSDSHEADYGRAAKLGFSRRLRDDSASPFGLIARSEAGCDVDPFPGWRYCPQYFADDQCFLVGDNSDQLQEPLCICMPSNLPLLAAPASTENTDWNLTELIIDVPTSSASIALQAVAASAPISLRLGRLHHLELVFNTAQQGQRCDLRTDLPMTIRW